MRMKIIGFVILAIGSVLWSLGAEFIDPDFPCYTLGESYSCEVTLHWWDLPSDDDLHLYVAIMDADAVYSYFVVAGGGYSPAESTITFDYPGWVPSYADPPIYFVVYWDDDYEPTEPDEILDMVELESCGGAECPEIATSGSLNFNLTEGESTPEPSSETFYIRDPDGVGWSLSSSCSWVNLSPSSGSGNRTITVTLDGSEIDDLSAGIYNCTITLYPSGSGCSTDDINVSLHITPAPECPEIVTSGSLNFDLTEGESLPEPGSRMFHISDPDNVGWSVRPEYSWVRVSPSSGTGDRDITVTLAGEEISHFPAGSYNCTITMHPDGTGCSEDEIEVNLNVELPLKVALVVRGERNGGSPWFLTNLLENTLKEVYTALDVSGYNIYLLHGDTANARWGGDYNGDGIADIDAYCSLAVLDSIVCEVANIISAASGSEIIMVFMDHGDPDIFYLNREGQALWSSYVANYADTLRRCGGHIKCVVIDGCNSGSFIDNLSYPGTIVITNQHAELEARQLISRFLFPALKSGYSFKEAFNKAAQWIYAISLFNDHALLDDNGDSIGTDAPLPDEPTETEDGYYSSTSFLVGGGWGPGSIPIVYEPNIFSTDDEVTVQVEISSVDSVLECRAYFVGSPDTSGFVPVKSFNLTQTGSYYVGIVPFDSIGFDPVQICVFVRTPSAISDPMCVSYTDIAENKSPNPVLSLLVNPSPFNSSLFIKYSVPSVSEISLCIYDITGHQISTLVEGLKTVGTYTTTWTPPDNIPSGIYLIRLKAGKQVITKQAVLIK